MGFDPLDCLTDCVGTIYDVVAMEKAVVALRPKPLAASANASWEEDLAAARRDPC